MSKPVPNIMLIQSDIYSSVRGLKITYAFHPKLTTTNKLERPRLHPQYAFCELFSTAIVIEIESIEM